MTNFQQRKNQRVRVEISTRTRLCEHILAVTFVTNSNRPQPLWQPPPTACLTASGAASEVPFLLTHPRMGHGAFGESPPRLRGHAPRCSLPLLGCPRPPTACVTDVKRVLLHRARTAATISGQTLVYHPKMHPPKQPIEPEKRVVASTRPDIPGFRLRLPINHGGFGAVLVLSWRAFDGGDDHWEGPQKHCLRQGTSKRGEGQPFLSC